MAELKTATITSDNAPKALKFWKTEKGKLGKNTKKESG